MVGEQLFDHRADLLGDVIGRKAKRVGNGQCRIGRFAVVAVKIPLISNRLVTLHQDTVTLAHFTIEIFHAQGFAPRAPVLKVAVAGEKSRVGADIDRQI